MKTVLLDEEGWPISKHLSKEERLEIFKQHNPNYAVYLVKREEERKQKQSRRLELEKIFITKATRRHNKFTARLIKIRDLRNERKTLQEIGDIMGVSRERIRQLSRHIQDWKHRLSIMPKPPKTYPCLRNGCGNQVIAIYHGKKYCSRDCWYLATGKNHLKDMTPEERRRYDNERAKRYIATHYRGTEEYKQRVKIYNNRRMKRYKYRILHDPKYAILVKKKIQEFNKKHRERMKTDPAYAEKKRAQWRRRNALAKARKLNY